MILIVGWIVTAVALAGCFSAELAQPHRFSEDPVEIVGNFFLGKEEGGNGYSVAMTPRPSTGNNAAYVVLISNF